MHICDTFVTPSIFSLNCFPTSERKLFENLHYVPRLTPSLTSNQMGGGSGLGSSSGSGPGPRGGFAFRSEFEFGFEFFGAGGGFGFGFGQGSL